MPFAADVEMVQLRFGRGYFLGDGSAAASISIKPVFPLTVTPALLWESTGDLYLPFTESVKAGPDQEASLLVPRTDQVGWLDQAGAPYLNWYYEATIRYTNGSDSLQLTKTVQPTKADMANGIDLEAVHTGAPSAPIPSTTYPVTNVTIRASDGHLIITRANGQTTDLGALIATAG